VMLAGMPAVRSAKMNWASIRGLPQGRSGGEEFSP
jgi:hypothetical protein